LYALGRYNINRKKNNGVTYPSNERIGPGQSIWEGVRLIPDLIYDGGRGGLNIAKTAAVWTGGKIAWPFKFAWSKTPSGATIGSAFTAALGTGAALGTLAAMAPGGAVVAGTYPIGAAALGLPLGVALYAGYRAYKWLDKPSGGATPAAHAPSGGHDEHPPHN
jgi:hypothetical protein